MNFNKFLQNKTLRFSLEIPFSQRASSMLDVLKKQIETWVTNCAPT